MGAVESELEGTMTLLAVFLPCTREWLLQLNSNTSCNRCSVCYNISRLLCSDFFCAHWWPITCGDSCCGSRYMHKASGSSPTSTGHGQQLNVASRKASYTILYMIITTIFLYTCVLIVLYEFHFEIIYTHSVWINEKTYNIWKQPSHKKRKVCAFSGKWGPSPIVHSGVCDWTDYMYTAYRFGSIN